MEFSQWLKEEMDKRGITKYRLHKLSGVHQTTILNLLNGAKPQIETEEKIRAAIAKMDEKKEKPAPDGGELDADTKELLDIWNGEDEAGRKALIEMARFIKSKREK